MGLRRLHGILFLILLLNLLLDPSVALGRAVGIYGLAVLVSLNAVAFAICSGLGVLALDRIQKKSALILSIYSFVILASSLVLSAFLYEQADKDFDVAKTIGARKIEYFCWKSFNPKKCVAQVQACATCAKQVDKWKRDIARDKLVAVRKTMK